MASICMEHHRQGYNKSTDYFDINLPKSRYLLHDLYNSTLTTVPWLSTHYYEMTFINEATQMKHSGKIPILTVDQPLYDLANKIQWLWPDEYDKGQYTALIGGLHIEMAFS